MFIDLSLIFSLSVKRFDEEVKVSESGLSWEISISSLEEGYLEIELKDVVLIDVVLDDNISCDNFSLLESFLLSVLDTCGLNTSG